MSKMRSKRNRGNGDGSLTQDKRSGLWTAWYFDADGKRVKRATGRTNRRDAEELLAKWTRETRDIRAGLLDPDAMRRRDERARALADHVREYFEAWNLKTRTRGVVSVRTSQFRTMLNRAREILKREPKLQDFKPELVARVMRLEIDAGKSHTTANNLRALAVTFAKWLTREGRAELADFGSRIETYDSELDRRRERRDLTTEELQRLFNVARARGRFLWYALAYYAGLRRGELGRVTWGEIDLESRTLCVKNTKARRVDRVSLHSALVLELAAQRPLLTPTAMSTARIFPQPVSRRTRLRDFERAEIPLCDSRGRVADLHALRSTLCTTLLRLGRSPTVVKDIMRHRSIATTLKHYSKLGLVDAEAALACVPAVGESTEVSATGTHDLRGSSNGSSRRTKRHDSASHAETARIASDSFASSQTSNTREVTRSRTTGRDNVISFPIPRALSSVD